MTHDLDGLRRLMALCREFGVTRIKDHGANGVELEFAQQAQPAPEAEAPPPAPASLYEDPDAYGGAPVPHFNDFKPPGTEQ